MSFEFTASYYMTRKVADRIAEDEYFADFVDSCIARFQRQDWGNLSREDREANDRAYASGDDSILASYQGADGVRLWIMTEWDRSATTVLFPEEY